MNHYNLYRVGKFAFRDEVLAPCFGVKTKMNGTIYPLTFDYAIE